MTTQSIKAQAKRIRQKQRREFLDFWNRHLDATDDALLIVLKSHIYIEGLIDNLLEMVLVTPSAAIQNESFANKLKIAESTGVLNDGQLITLKALNKLRN